MALLRNSEVGLELEAKGIQVNFEELKEDLVRRDYADSNRDTSPLKKANDAILLDTTELSIEEVVLEICKLIEGRTK